MDSPTFTEEELKATAHHEAGHVFILLLFEYQFASVSINEQNNTGETNFDFGAEQGDQEHLLNKYIRACIAMSGSISQDKFMDNNTQHGYSLMKSGGDDFRQILELHLPEGSFLPLLDQTNKIITENWKQVSKIADKIHLSRTVSRDEIEQIVSSADLNEKRELYKQELESILR